MADSLLLKLYKDLEEVAQALEGENEELYDKLVDAMDPLWYALTEAERLGLDERPVVDRRS